MSPREATEWLLQELARLLRDDQIARGYWFQQLGAVQLPNGRLLFLRGSELLPYQSKTPFMLAPPLGKIELAGTRNTSIQNIIMNLQLAPLEALLVIAYVVLASVRSLVLDAGIDL